MDFTPPLQGSTFHKQQKGFRENTRLQSSRDISSTSRNLEITPQPKILLKAKVFASLLCFLPLFSCQALSLFRPPFFLFTSGLKKAFCHTFNTFED